MGERSEVKRQPIKIIRAEDFSEYRIAEFWSKVRLSPTGCMIFEGDKNGSGYGRGSGTV